MADDLSGLSQEDISQIAAYGLSPCKGNLQLINFGWKKTGFDTVGEISYIKIKNTGKDACKDILGSIEYAAKSGTSFGGKFFIIYDSIPAGKIKTFHNINVGFIPQASQAATANVSIVSGLPIGK